MHFSFKSEQPTVGWIAIFHKYCCYIKHGGIIANLTQWNPRGMLLIWYTSMRIYGAWNSIYYVLCTKTYDTFGVCFRVLLIRDRPLGAPVFVRLAYWHLWWYFRTNDPSDQWPYGPMILRTNDPSDQWLWSRESLTFGLTTLRTNAP